MTRRELLKELRDAQRKPRVLVAEDVSVPVWDREKCVMCGKSTVLWLQPENAPLCSQVCLTEYLKDPSVYDPRELYSASNPRLLQPAPVAVAKPAPKRRKQQPGRWEPDSEYIEQAQERLRQRRARKD